MTDKAESTPHNMPVTDETTSTRIGFAAVLAAALLIGANFAQWRALIYAHYLTGAALQTAVLLLATYWAVAGIFRTPLRRARSWGDLLLFCYILYTAAATLWSPNHRLAAIGSLLLLFPVFWARGLGQVLGGIRDRRLLLRAFFIAGIIASILGMIHAHRKGHVVDVELVFGHRNFLAIFLLPCILLCIADIFAPLFSRDTKPGNILGWPFWITVIGLIPMLVGLALCRSIGSGLGLVAGALCLIAVRLSRQQRRILIALIVVALLLGTAILFLPGTPKLLLEKSPSQATRWFMWQETLQMIARHPVIGWGANVFQLYFPGFKSTLPMKYGITLNTTIYPHNELLMVTVDGGLIGLGLYLAAFFLIVRRHLRAAEKESADSDDRLARWAIFAGFAAMFAQGLVSVALRFWAPSLAYWTLVGLMLASATKPTMAPARKGWLAVTARVAIAMIMIAFIGILFYGIVWQGMRAEWLMTRGQVKGKPSLETRAARYVSAEYASRYVPDYMLAIINRAQLFQKAGRGQEAITAYEQLNRIAPGYGPVNRVLGALYLQRAEEVGSKDPKRKAWYLQKSNEYLQAAIEQNPYDPNARLTIARVLREISVQNIPFALDHLRAAAEAAPQNPVIPLRIAALLAETGQKSEALTELDRAEKLCTEKNKALRRGIEQFRKQIENSQ